ncbi:MAG: sigma-70 family RNA polymerase sigma factor [Pyrinomonadaceae bacterium]|nr:sigma-70 family RNA polymerase sigma factor [Pyrinomonadaceae bacterium]
MKEPSPPDITQMLIDWSNGDQEALDRLMPVVYAELRRQAARHLRHERPGHTLQPTDLIHEAYLRLIDQKNVRWQNRAHFYAVAAQSMRRILVDHARRRHRAKRGGSGIALPLEEGLLVATGKSEVDLLDLDEALTRLAAIDVRQSQIVELRFFSGLSIEETAAVIGVSRTTVKDDLNMAKAWLRRELDGGKTK